MKKTIRSSIAMLITLVIVTAVPFTAYAKTEAAGGTCGPDLSWTIEGDTLTIIGTGEMDDWGYNDDEPWSKHMNPPWHEALWKNDVAYVNISEGVTSIGNGAFSGYSESGYIVSIPSTVAHIHEEAIPGYNVQEINVSADNPGYCSIDGVLYDKNVDTLLCYPEHKKDAIFIVPASVKSINQYCFGKYIKEIDFSETELTVIDALFDMPELRTLILPASIEVLPNTSDCPKLTRAIIKGFSEIYSSSDGAIYSADRRILCYCPDGMTSYTMPARVEAIETVAVFNNCKTLSKITVEEGNKYFSVKNGMLYGDNGRELIFCPYNIGKIIIDAETERISPNAFGNCGTVDSIEVDSNNRYFSTDGKSLFDIDKTRMLNFFGIGSDFSDIYWIDIPETVQIIEDNNLLERLDRAVIRYNGSSDSWKKVVQSSMEEKYGYYVDNTETGVVVGQDSTTFTLEFVDSLTYTFELQGDAVVLMISGKGKLDRSHLMECFRTANVSKLIIGSDVLADTDVLSGLGDHLEHIDVAEGNKYFTSIAGVLFTTDKTEMLMYPKERKDTDLYLPAELKEFNPYMLKDNKYLQNIYVDEGNESYSSYDGVLYDKNCTKIECYPISRTAESVTVPGSVEVYGLYQLEDNTYLKNIYINGSSEGLFSIDGVLYFDSGYSKRLEIYPAGREEAEFTIPAFVNSMWSDLFSDNPYLQNIYVDENNEHYISIDGIVYSRKDSNLICFPHGRSSEEFRIIPQVEAVHLSIFSRMSDLKALYLPDTLLELSGGSRKNSNYRIYTGPYGRSLNNLSYDYRFASNIRGGLFYDNDSIVEYDTALKDDGSVKIEYYLGLGGDVVIPDCIAGGKVTEIGDYAFFDTTTLSGVTLGKSITHIGDFSFSYCKGLTSVYFGKELRSIGANAFYASDVRDVYYQGSEEDWADISIADGNERLKKARIHFNTELTQLTSESGEVTARLTAWEKNLNASTQLEAVPVASTASADDIYAQSADGTKHNCAVYDLSMLADGKKVQPSSVVQMGIPLPEGFDGSQCEVYQIVGDKSCLSRNAKYVDGRLEFTANHFSYYAIVDCSESVSISAPSLNITDADNRISNTESNIDVEDNYVFVDSDEYDQFDPNFKPRKVAPYDFSRKTHPVVWVLLSLLALAVLSAAAVLFIGNKADDNDGVFAVGSFVLDQRLTGKCRAANSAFINLCTKIKNICVPALLDFWKGIVATAKKAVSLIKETAEKVLSFIKSRLGR